VATSTVPLKSFPSQLTVISSEGSLTGDVVTQHIGVEDGSVLKGGVQVRAVEHKNDRSNRQSKAAAAVAGT